MRKFNSPYLADWFVISLRWLTLFVFGAFFAHESEWLSLFPFLLMALWNVTLSVMAGLNIRFGYHRQISVGIDLLFALTLFGVHSGLNGSLWGLAVLPILSGAIYYEFLGGLLSAGVMSVAYMLYAYIFMSLDALPLAGIMAGAMLFLGAVFSFLSKKMIGSIRVKREVKKDTEVQERRVENERIRAIYELTSTLTATLSYSHVLEAALAHRQHLRDGAEVLLGHVDRDPVDRLVRLAADLSGDDLGLADGELEALAAHRLDEHRELELAAALHLPRVGPLGGAHAQGHVADELGVEAALHESGG